MGKRPSRDSGNPSQLAGLLASIPGHTFLVQRDGVILHHYACRPEIMAYNPGVAAGGRVDDLLGPTMAPRFREVFQDVCNAGVCRTLCGIWGQGEDARHLEAFMAPSDGGTIAVFVRDVSARARAEQAVHSLEGRARQNERLCTLGRLAAGIAHDVNNQINTLLFIADALKKAADDPPRVRRCAETLHRQAGATSGLTSRLLAFVRNQTPDPEAVDVHTVLRDLRDLLSHTVDRRIQVNLALDAKAAVVHACRSQIENALLNLALNARDAMPSGGTLHMSTGNVTLAGGRCPHLRAPFGAGSYLRLEVRDTGSGIDMAMLPRLFEPFATTKGPHGGCGLGLPCVADAVAAQGGCIDVESTPGQGTCFRLFLPVRDDPGGA